MQINIHIYVDAHDTCIYKHICMHILCSFVNWNRKSLHYKYKLALQSDNAMPTPFATPPSYCQQGNADTIWHKLSLFNPTTAPPKMKKRQQHFNMFRRSNYETSERRRIIKSCKAAEQARSNNNNNNKKNNNKTQKIKKIKNKNKQKRCQQEMHFIGDRLNCAY